ncbi:MAG: DoxX family protein [Vicinamibacterales bacterium]|nr:DoxX family protein [Vicinamibacterales bacterium]MEE2609843.1 DoxX family protein [Acidobacteriota bacterium]|tara:strand:- start:996 stop:1457 length:462 start_codon:yes stop_codon:yes gene_type:complete
MMQAWGVTLLRLTVGAVFVAHGLPKLFGPMWGTSPEGTVALFALVGLQPAPLLAVTVGIVELCGGTALFLGAFTRLMSALLAIIMAVAIWKVHWPYGFFLNLSLEPGVGHGFEYALVLFAALFCLMLNGPGVLSFDGYAGKSAKSGQGRSRRD